MKTFQKLEVFLKNWIATYIKEILGDLLNLNREDVTNKYIRALMFQLFENNGVIKRDIVKEIVSSIKADERKKIWNLGIKIGRYHIYLPKMLKPKAVSLRISLWKLFYQTGINQNIPRSGLNYLADKKYDKNFLLLCGFEKFKNHYVRIDILEKLFIKILDKTEKRKFKIDADMINLIGCNKENFYSLMISMNYKKSKEPDTYFYTGEIKRKSKFLNINKSENPFRKLLALNLK